MREYSNKISLIRNGRGIYGLDTSIGCSSGMEMDGGCYNDCYAAKASARYGYDFSKTVLRFFENEQHKRDIINQINKVKLDFIRIGCSGDPSEDWQHTFDILRVICRSNKHIVIITKHWTLLKDEHLQALAKMNVCINTSISALDKPDQLSRNVEQYNRIKPYCKSVLRIVSCDFNLNNPQGHALAKVQANLFNNENTLDTVFRPNKNNPLVADGIINVSKGLFLGKRTLMSKFNRKTFTGKCSNCHEMCGVKINVKYEYPDKTPFTIQTDLFHTSK